VRPSPCQLRLSEFATDGAGAATRGGATRAEVASCLHVRVVPRRPSCDCERRGCFD
jgi:hypothetical protein